LIIGVKKNFAQMMHILIRRCSSLKQGL